MKVSELKQMIKDMDDETKLRVVAPNGPPWITHFVIEVVPSEEE